MRIHQQLDIHLNQVVTDLSSGNQPAAIQVLFYLGDFLRRNFGQMSLPSGVFEFVQQNYLKRGFHTIPDPSRVQLKEALVLFFESNPFHCDYYRNPNQPELEAKPQYCVECINLGSQLLYNLWEPDLLEFQINSDEVQKPLYGYTQAQEKIQQLLEDHTESDTLEDVEQKINFYVSIEDWKQLNRWYDKISECSPWLNNIFDEIYHQLEKNCPCTLLDTLYDEITTQEEEATLAAIQDFDTTLDIRHIQARQTGFDRLLRLYMLDPGALNLANLRQSIRILQPRLNGLNEEETIQLMCSYLDFPVGDEEITQLTQLPPELTQEEKYFLTTCQQSLVASQKRQEDTNGSDITPAELTISRCIFLMEGKAWYLLENENNLAAITAMEMANKLKVATDFGIQDGELNELDETQTTCWEIAKKVLLSAMDESEESPFCNMESNVFRTYARTAVMAITELPGVISFDLPEDVTVTLQQLYQLQEQNGLAEETRTIVSHLINATKLFFALTEEEQEAYRHSHHIYIRRLYLEASNDCKPQIANAVAAITSTTTEELSIRDNIQQLQTHISTFENDDSTRYEKATEVVTSLTKATDDHYALAPEDRENNYQAYEAKMTKIVEQTKKSSLANHQDLGSKVLVCLTNILAVVVTGGLSFVYCALTQKSRGGFWLNHNTRSRDKADEITSTLRLRSH